MYIFHVKSYFCTINNKWVKKNNNKPSDKQKNKGMHFSVNMNRKANTAALYYRMFILKLYKGFISKGHIIDKWIREESDTDRTIMSLKGLPQVDVDVDKGVKNVLEGAKARVQHMYGTQPEGIFFL